MKILCVEDGSVNIEKLENGVDKNGNTKYIVKANPNYVIIKDKTASCMKISDQLGLSPLGRARAFKKKIKLLETDRDAWKRACELACEREDDCYVYDNIHRAYEFYQQAKKEKNENKN